MINRVLIRIKIIQIIYSYYQNGGKNLESSEKELFFSISKAYDLYNYLLLLMVAVTNYAQKRYDVLIKKSNTESNEQMPSRKFIENKFIAQLEGNKMLLDYIETQKRTWSGDDNFLRNLYHKILEGDIYKQYASTPDSSYEEDQEFWRKIYKSYIQNNDELDNVLEDISLYWNDDKEIVDTFVLKTIKRFDPKNGANQELLPEFKDDEDKDFARRLFRHAILNGDDYGKMISENSRNWDVNRIALMDFYIMQVALAEILTFPNIPISVTLNEYVEIAKLYSTPRSGGFVNGTLDGIVKLLKKENKLLKN